MAKGRPGLINRAASARQLAADKARERVSAFHCALGRFVAMFARVEFSAHIVLRHYAKMSFPAAHALLSGVRVDDTLGRLKRLFEIGFLDETSWNDIKPTLEHLNEINNRRNFILHHTTVAVEEGEGQVSNLATAHFAGSVRVFQISAAILDDMTADLKKIILHLHARHAGMPDPQDPKVDAILRAPWRYTLKSSPPVRPPKAEHPVRTTKPVRAARSKQPRD
jgi:hypothetical protein